MTFKITIKTDNAAFEDNGMATEMGRILRDLADKIEQGELPPLKLRDSNGNAVGTFQEGR